MHIEYEALWYRKARCYSESCGPLICFIWQEVQLGPSEQRFVLEGLEQGVRYTIFVMAYKGDRQSRKTDSTFSTGRNWP